MEAEELGVIEAYDHVAATLPVRYWVISSTTVWLTVENASTVNPATADGVWVKGLE